MQRVYATLCPQMVDYKKYTKTAIPLEVLGLIHLSINEGYFTDIEIWYDDKTPDPLAVGLIKTSQYSIKDTFLMARWGDVLKPFEELKAQAIKVYTNSSKIKLQQRLVETQNFLSNVELNSERYFDVQAESYQVTGF